MAADARASRSGAVGQDLCHTYVVAQRVMLMDARRKSRAMDRTAWAKLVSNEGAFRRAGGRRRVNALRKEAALLRRQRLLEALLAEGRSLCDRGVTSWWATRGGISRRTAQRDLAWVVTELARTAPDLCPLCGGTWRLRSPRRRVSPRG